MNAEAAAEKHRKLHTNDLFYSLSPELSVATARAICECWASGGYYEFGLFKGYNLWWAERFVAYRGLAGWHFYGFDSFEGMPVNDVHPHWAEGNYAASQQEVERHIKENGGDLSKITLVKGWFTDRHFEQIRKQKKLMPAAVVVVDSDLYESCVPVLRFIGPLLAPGSMILFDDWHAYDDDPTHGEQRAWGEFLAVAGSVAVKHVFDFGKYGRVFCIMDIEHASGR